MQKNNEGATPSILARLANALGADVSDWFRAMRAETECIDSSTGRLLWNFGIGVALLRCAVRKIINANSRRPLEVHATAFYLFAFSAYVLIHLVTEISNSGIHESWYEAWFPVLVCFWLAIIPSIIATGTWLCDDFARRLAIAFAIVELGMVSFVVHSYGVNDFRLLKFFCSVAVLAAMLSPRVKAACGSRPQNSPSHPLGIDC